MNMKYYKPDTDTRFGNQFYSDRGYPQRDPEDHPPQYAAGILVVEGKTYPVRVTRVLKDVLGGGRQVKYHHLGSRHGKNDLVFVKVEALDLYGFIEMDGDGDVVTACFDERSKAEKLYARRWAKAEAYAR